MDIITINLKELKKRKLDINQYLTLLRAYLFSKGEDIPFASGEVIVDHLVKRGFMEDIGKDVLLSEKGRKLFQVDKDLFEEFYNFFPDRVPNGSGGWRPVSTSDPNHRSAKETKNIWKKVTHGEEGLQRHIIKCLKIELEHREKTNSLRYLSNIDAWLKQSNWEKWEHIEVIDVKSSSTQISKLLKNKQ